MSSNRVNIFFLKIFASIATGFKNEKTRGEKPRWKNENNADNNGQLRTPAGTTRPHVAWQKKMLSKVVQVVFLSGFWGLCRVIGISDYRASATSFIYYLLSTIYYPLSAQRRSARFFYYLPSVISSAVLEVAQCNLENSHVCRSDAGDTRGLAQVFGPNHCQTLTTFVSQR